MTSYPRRSAQPERRRVPTPIIAALVLLLGLGACGASGSNSEPTATTAPSASSSRAGSPTTASSPPSSAGSPTGGETATPNAAAAGPGCIDAADPNASLDLQGYEAELTCAVSLFPWPTDYHLDTAHLVESYAALGPELFEAGSAAGDAALANACAWYSSWLEATQSGDQESASEALDRIVNLVPNYPSLIPGFPPGALDASVTSHWEELGRRALSGDTSAIQREVTTLCRAYVYEGRT